MPLSIGIGIAAALGKGVGGFLLAAPVLTCTSAANVNAPTFNADLPAAALSTDTLRFQVASDTGFSTNLQTTTCLVSAIESHFGLSALSDGTSYARCRLERPSGTAASPWSNVATQTIDATAPTITSGSSANNAENSVLAFALTANETVTWSITGGADQAKFEISGSTLRWAGNGTKDYETPDDADTNNTYIVQVTATDTAGNTTNKTVTITVTDVAEGATFSLAFVANSEVTVDGTSMTFASMSFGVADTNRVIAVAIGWRQTNGTDNISGVTIGGVTAALVSGADSGGIGTQLARSQVWYASVPTGTSGDVVVTFSGGNATRASCGLYRIITSTPTPTNGSGALAANAAVHTASVATTVPASGKGLVGAFCRNGNGVTLTWTNASGDYSANVESVSKAGSATVAASATLTADFAAGDSGISIAAAAWGP